MNCRFYSIVLISLITNAHNKEALSEKPKYLFSTSFKYNDTLDENPTGKHNVWTRLKVNGVESFFARSDWFRMVPFAVTCVATYPVTIIVNGQFNLAGSINIGHFRRTRNSTSTLNKYEVSAFLNPRMLFNGIGSEDNTMSATIRCHKISDITLGSYFNLFYTSHDTSYPSYYKEHSTEKVPNLNNLFYSGRTIELKDVKEIPCALTNPFIDKKEMVLKGPPEIHNVNIEYDPIRGFILPFPIKGQFTCNLGRTGESVTFVNELSKFTMDNGDEFFPSSPSGVIQVSQIKLFGCKSSYEIEIVAQKTIPGFASYAISANPIYVLNDTNNKQFYFNSTTPQAIVVECFKNLILDKYSIYDWIYYITPIPNLVLDNDLQTFSCEAEPLDFKMQYTMWNFKCQNPPDCKLKQSCLHSILSCHEMHSNFYETTGVDGVKGEMTFWSGLIHCQRVTTDATRSWEYFTALNNFRYYDYRQVEEHYLVALRETPSTIYTNLTYTFTCTAVSFLFAENLEFYVNLDNGKETRVADLFYTEANYDVNSHHIRRSVRMKLSLQAIGVSCYAPWFNSTDRMKTSRSVVVTNLIPATIKKTNPHHILFIGDNSTSKLTCAAKGEPTPKYLWYYNDQVLNPSNSDHYTSALGENGEGILEFKRILTNMSGVYTCVAENWNGTAYHNFTVDVQEKPISIALGSVITLSIGLGFLFVLLATTLCYVVYLQYSKIKKLRRKLTADEVKEFREGVADKSQTDGAVWNGVGFDERYEIDRHDLDYDSAKIMGSGNFSTVVVGFLKSLGERVAIKMPKITTNVDEFKLMLAEIKIMIYIGRHENIVSFIGACTEDIVKKKIHIVLELAENGCLKSYLMKNGPRQSEATSEDDESCKIRELDLVRWSYQISKGMEFLSQKQIIHADLATRNVLLTSTLTAKISDFGLSKQLYKTAIYNKQGKGALPWRWMALESLTALEFSSASDVWSYGVTLWEIFSYGEIPFPNGTWTFEFVDLLKNGLRLMKPEHCPPDIFATVLTCWEAESSARPTFTTLQTILYNHLQNYEADQGYHRLILENDTKIPE